MKKFREKMSERAGFTLVELIVVIAILGILAGAAVAGYSGYITKAKDAADTQVLSAIKTATDATLATKGTVSKIEVAAASGTISKITATVGSDSNTVLYDVYLASGATQTENQKATATETGDFTTYMSGNSLKFGSDTYASGATWTPTTTTDGGWVKN